MSDPALKETLSRVFNRSIPPSAPFNLVKLFGEASARQYFRVQFEDGKTLILMKLPPGAASVAEEITKSDKKIEELPFVNIQKYLSSLELPVPKIIGYDAADGLMLLEDLGDKTLEKALEPANPEIFIFLYKKAIELLAKLQQKTREHPKQECIAFHRRFDEELLFWELNHFLEYGIEDRLQVKVTAAEKKRFEELGRDICKKIVQMPQGFTHRDFQSRNLMVHGYDFWMIDFQDALLGPVLYDLVALLRDSYIAFSPEQLKTLLQAYADTVDSKNPYSKNFERIQQDFDLITLQRKLKDTGRFQYIHTVKKNPNFLKHVPQSLEYVRQAFERRPEYKDMYAIVAKYVPEFGGKP